MSTINTQQIVDQVRSLINRIEPLKADGTSFAVSTPANVEDTPSRTVHDAFLADQIDYIQKYLCQACKAWHVSPLIQEHKGSVSRYNSLNDRLRILHGRIERLGADCSTSNCKYIVARFRGVAEHEMLQQAGRVASACYPAYTWQDDHLEVYPKDSNDENAITILVDYIRTPAKISTISSGTNLELDSRFLGPIVAYVTSKAFTVLGDDVHSTAWLEIFQRRVGPFLRSTSIGKVSALGDPVIVAQESEIE